MKVLVLGANGMAGHMIVYHLLEQGHYVVSATRNRANLPNNLVLNYTDFQGLKNVFLNNDFDYIINCVGILNNNAENEKAEAVYYNSFLPHFIADSIQDSNCRLIHLSTDCVFSGEKGHFTEKEFANSNTFYGKTKALGEIKDNKNLTFRNSIIGPDMKITGKGLFNWFMMQDDNLNGYSRVIWSGVSTITLARAIDEAMRQKITGLYHLCNNTVINKYELLKLFSKYLKNDRISIQKTDFIKEDRSLVNTRNDFFFTVPSYEKMVIEIKDWIENHKSFYPHYFKG